MNPIIEITLSQFINWLNCTNRPAILERQQAISSSFEYFTDDIIFSYSPKHSYTWEVPSYAR